MADMMLISSGVTTAQQGARSENVPRSALEFTKQCVLYLCATATHLPFILIIIILLLLFLPFLNCSLRVEGRDRLRSLVDLFSCDVQL
jgi:hypothetical protein